MSDLDKRAMGEADLEPPLRSPGRDGGPVRESRFTAESTRDLADEIGELDLESRLIGDLASDLDDCSGSNVNRSIRRGDIVPGRAGRFSGESLLDLEDDIGELDRESRFTS
eukprot:GILK01034127.1.p2 GENE.GILK01034127.1~~GILK01034127.1.p2  ORF type:complete len:111 (-),score=21.39 GILK01034127.1:1-333(-)